MTCQFEECTRYVENAFMTLCASHAIAARKEERQSIKDAEKKRKILSTIKLKKPKAIAKHSDTNTYADSVGNRYTKVEVERLIHLAKAEKLASFMAEHDYYFCEEKEGEHNGPIDCSHNISVSECQLKGLTEYSWDVNNITLRCRRHHNIHDRSGLQWNVNKDNSL